MDTYMYNDVYNDEYGSTQGQIMRTVCADADLYKRIGMRACLFASENGSDI